MAPGDRATVTLDITNFTGKAGDFKVRVDGIGPASVGEGSRTLQLAGEAKSTLSFPLAAQEGYSVAQVRIRVDGNGATGGEVMTLARAIQTSVYERFGIRLEPEPVVI